MNPYSFNLSDFSLFLSVMKNPRAYECTLSIILDEPNIQLREVKVEQVILNHFGKKSIRLDAWAVSSDQRQFNMEMQNDSKGDDLPRRSRFYQSLIDSPVLKSGSKTKYRSLPPTVIIFITQEDIFKKDLAKYTFTENCKEIPELSLNDGTTKIFLNMESKNGSQELISLLQYMKETRIDNPEILVKDARILELDQIVTEVKESEEWEAVRMNFMEICQLEGEKRGRNKTLIPPILKKHAKNKSLEVIAEELEQTVDEIRPIYDLIIQHPDKNVDELLALLDK